jgi:polar amino acid transport system permease protein
MHYDWDLGVLANRTTIELLLRGLALTLELTLICIVAGTPLGFLVGCLPTFVGDVRWLRGIRQIRPAPSYVFPFAAMGRVLSRIVVFLFVDVLRAVPLLLLMFICYYGLPYLFGSSSLQSSTSSSQGVQVSAFTSAAVAMSVNLAAFVADLVRAGLDGVQRGNVLAAFALGMTRGLVIRRIIVPEVVREIWPSLILLYITMLKMSTLASAITVWEVMHSAESLIQTSYRVLELYLAVCGIFVVMITPLSMIARGFERSRVLTRRS